MQTIAKQYSVYYLSDPITSRVRYVGCSCRPSARYDAHLEAAGDSHRARWIRKLWEEVRLLPVFSVKCIVQSEQEMFRIEKALIAKLREKGEPLTNMTEGGDGIVNPLPEVRAKRSAAMIGNTRFVGHAHSEETKRKMRESRLRFNVEHPEIVARIASKQIGNTRGSLISEEARQKKRESMRGNTRNLGNHHTEAWKLEQSVRRAGNKSRTGMTNSEESNARRSAALKSAWARRKAMRGEQS